MNNEALQNGASNAEFRIKKPDFRHIIKRRPNESGPSQNPVEQPRSENPWVPFLDNPQPEDNFVVLYGGPFASLLQYNSENAERLLKVAGFDGRVVVSDLDPNFVPSTTTITPDLNADGSIARRKPSPADLFKKPGYSQEGKFSRIQTTPEGVRIEIAGGRILESLRELDRRQHNNRRIDERFLKIFNTELRKSMTKALWEEKISVHNFRDALNHLETIVGSSIPFAALGDGADVSDVRSLFWPLGLWTFVNLSGYTMGRFVGKKMGRTIESPAEIMFPPDDVDRFTRGMAFLEIKGRNLVRLKPQENNSV